MTKLRDDVHRQFHEVLAPEHIDLDETIEEWAARWSQALKRPSWEALDNGHEQPDDCPLHTAGPDGGEATTEQRNALLAHRNKVATGLSDYHRKVLARTRDDWSHAPWVAFRTAMWSTMACLRDRHGLVEDGLGLWRRTDFGREIRRMVDV